MQSLSPPAAPAAGRRTYRRRIAPPASRTAHSPSGTRPRSCGCRSAHGSGGQAVNRLPAYVSLSNGLTSIVLPS